MKVILASKYGFCMGVKRALSIVDSVGSSGATILHQIVHNPSVSKQLHEKGIGEEEEIDNVKSKTVIFSAHGVSPQIRWQAEKLGFKMIDATCPLVLKVHGIVRSYAMRGYEFIYVGHRGHPEPKGVMGEAPGRVQIIEKKEEIKDIEISNPEKLVVVTQTTLSVLETEEIVKELRKMYPKAKVFNTVCRETADRQKALSEILERVDLVIVVGGKNSSNSQRLADLAISSGKRGYLVEGVSDIKKDWFKGAEVVGLTAGASTPDEETEKVKRWIESI